ncbi:MAG: hypothetical protein Tsb005_14220 [Gammaproteobacteria bacterium]
MFFSFLNELSDKEKAILANAFYTNFASITFIKDVLNKSNIDRVLWLNKTTNVVKKFFSKSNGVIFLKSLFKS